MSEKLSDVSARLGFGRLTLANIYFFVFLAVYGCFVLAFIGKTGPALLFPLYFVLAMLVATTFNRTVSLGWVLMFFIYGSTAVAFVILVLSWPVNAVFGTDSLFAGAVVIPILEEALKVAPLVVFLLLKRWRFRWTAGALDLMVLGAAVGAGFAFFEDTLLGFASGGFGRIGAAEYIMRSHEATPHLGPLYLFPSMDIATADTAFIGHAAATALVGLALGLARMLGLRLRRGGWVLPAVVLLWVIMDHVMFNWVVHEGGRPGLAKFYYTLNAGGMLTSIVLYLALIGTVVYERVILQRNRERTRHYRLERDNLKLFKGSIAGLEERLGAIFRLRRYIQERRGLTYGLHLLDSAGSEDRGERVDRLEAVAYVLALWKGELEVTPSLPIGELEAAPSQPMGELEAAPPQPMEEV
jgi:RsiW-degrading membrane proteinase PrsW (M82 family)